jgi:SAM-dependent methyltransferase
MNKYIKNSDKGIEVGCGTGVSKFFIKNKNLRLTDYSNKDWLDVKEVDALNTPFAVNSFDYVISSNMIHHVPYPNKFFREMNRILKPGGYLLIQELNNSFFMRLFLRLMRHEGYNYGVNVFKEKVCTDKNDLWSANCAIPNLLFDDKARFKKAFGQFEVISDLPSEFIIFLNSGGVISKTFFLPLPIAILKIVRKMDNFLARSFPKVFALQRQIILRKVE